MKFSGILAATAIWASAALAMAELPSTVLSLSAAGSQKYSISQGPSGTFGSAKVSTVLNEVITLDPATEAALAADTDVNINLPINGFSFKFSDDPNWTPGATSVSIKRTLNDGIAFTQTINLSWGGGQMTISAKVKGKGAGNISVTGKTRDVETFNISTTLAQGGNNLITAGAVVPVAVSQTGKQKVDLNGTESMSQSIKFKTAKYTAAQVQP